MANMSLEEQVGLFISPELPVTMGGHDRRISDGRTFTPDSRFEISRDAKPDNDTSSMILGGAS